jgi:hypothetical protein
VVIAGGVRSEQRKTETVLPLDRTVAGACVAPQPAEERDDVPAEERSRGARFSRGRRAPEDQDEPSDQKASAEHKQAPVVAVVAASLPIPSAPHRQTHRDLVHFFSTLIGSKQ